MAGEKMLSFTITQKEENERVCLKQTDSCCKLFHNSLFSKGVRVKIERQLCAKYLYIKYSKILLHNL